jgi:hypothetical protein
MPVINGSALMVAAGLTIAVIALILLLVFWLRNHRLRFGSQFNWSIGFMRGASPMRFSESSAFANPMIRVDMIPDRCAQFVADPFLFRYRNSWYLFCEVQNEKSGRGEIGCFLSENLLEWKWKGCALAEKFHVSYPYVFMRSNELYMVPESAGGNGVRLYRATSFPLGWELVDTLLTGSFCDSCVLFRNSTWWLFTCDEPYHHSRLRLFYSDDLHGPYQEHPKSPLIAHDGSRARPGGRIIEYNGMLVRYAQNSWPRYGKELWAYSIEILTRKNYREHRLGPRPVLGPGHDGWNRHGMHHCDAWQLSDGSWIAAVDGYYKSARITFEY